jgi:hypothetical protein
MRGDIMVYVDPFEDGQIPEMICPKTKKKIQCRYGSEGLCGECQENKLELSNEKEKKNTKNWYE